MLDQFLSGALCFAHVMASLFFFRFWKKSHDSLFLMFALAFTLLGVEKIILTLNAMPADVGPFIYLVRLAAFLLIIAAIINKNRPVSR